MACITLFAQPMAMATTQLARETHYQDTPVWQAEGNLEHSCLRMSWVVVTEENGNRRLQMQWDTENPADRSLPVEAL